MADIHIGTAGYSYAHWRNGVFYPRVGVTQSQELRHYSGVFSAVEINSSFHAVPRKETLDNWARQVKPGGFVFCFKAPQEITHVKRLEGIDDSWDYFLKRLVESTMQQTDNSSLLGPILFQLPPSLPKNIFKLDEISRLLTSFANGKNELRIAFEFRHQSWYCDEVFASMRRHGFGLCENISPDNSTLHCQEITASTWHYIRFHKRSGEDRLQTNFTREQLAAVADQLVKRREKNISQYCFFLNDHEGNGPRNAQTLVNLLKERLDGPLVLKWKPDPSTPSIKSIFSKAPPVGKSSLTKSGSDNISSVFSPTLTTKEKAKRSIDSFFSPAGGSTKRTKISAKVKSSTKRKGTITNFFSSKA